MRVSFFSDDDSLHEYLTVNCGDGDSIVDEVHGPALHRLVVEHADPFRVVRGVGDKLVVRTVRDRHGTITKQQSMHLRIQLCRVEGGWKLRWLQIQSPQRVSSSLP